MTETPNDPVIGDAPPAAPTLLSNRAYDVLKNLAQIWLPAFAVFYIAIAPLWGLPKQEEIAGTVMALDLFLGAVLGIATKHYQNADARFSGQLTVLPAEDEDYSNLRVQVDPADLMSKREVTLRVVK